MAAMDHPSHQVVGVLPAEAKQGEGPREAGEGWCQFIWHAHEAGRQPRSKRVACSHTAAPPLLAGHRSLPHVQAQDGEALLGARQSLQGVVLHNGRGEASRDRCGWARAAGVNPAGWYQPDAGTQWQIVHPACTHQDWARELPGPCHGGPQPATNKQPPVASALPFLRIVRASSPSGPPGWGWSGSSASWCGGRSSARPSRCQTRRWRQWRRPAKQRCGVGDGQRGLREAPFG